MLAQIRLLSVALAAILTDVCLKMFRLLVLGDVLEKAGLVGEALVARVALVRLVGLVAARVRLEVGQLREGFLASGMAALVRFVPSVGPDVLLQVGQLGELALADLAAVGLDAEMDARVLGEIAGVGKGLGALAALVGLGLAQMYLRVELQIGFGSEHLE